MTPISRTQVENKRGVPTKLEKSRPNLFFPNAKQTFLPDALQKT